MLTLEATTTKRITKALKDLYKKRDFDLHYAESWLRENGYQISHQTVWRVLQGKVRKIQKRTAYGLAEFIEKETRGELPASTFLEDSIKDLTYLNLENETIKNANWSGANLRFTNLKKSTLINCDFRGAFLEGAQLQEATIINSVFDRAQLVGTTLQNITAESCTFVEADIQTSSWRSARITRCSFRNCLHTGVDMRDVVFEDTSWLSDRYRGGLTLTGAKLDGLKGISESHGILKQIVLNIADGRPRFQAFAGFTDLRIMGCWQAGLNFLETEFADSERREILDGFSAYRDWFNGFRIEFEYQKRGLLIREFGEDFSKWPHPKTYNTVVSGAPLIVNGVKGKINKRGLFVPDTFESEDYDEDKWKADEILALALV